jgi:hypothetical protein
MAKEFTEKAPNVPTDARALRRLQQLVEVGELEEALSPCRAWPATWSRT